MTDSLNNYGTYRYDAFGNVREASSFLADEVGENPWQFSTKYHDPETAFSYYGYRYYDPVTGRWPSRDPIGESFRTKEFNIYAFVKNDGVNFLDVLGREIQDDLQIEVTSDCTVKAKVTCVCFWTPEKPNEGVVCPDPTEITATGSITSREASIAENEKDAELVARKAAAKQGKKHCGEDCVSSVKQVGKVTCSSSVQF